MIRKLAPATASFLASFLLFASHSGAQNRPCADDARKYCPEVTPGRGAIVNCLKPHLDRLSEGCRKQLARAEARQKGTTERHQKARALRAGMHTPPPGAATPAAPTREPTKS